MKVPSDVHGDDRATRSAWLAARPSRVEITVSLPCQTGSRSGAMVWGPVGGPWVLDALGIAVWPWLDGTLTVRELAEDIASLNLTDACDPELLVIGLVCDLLDHWLITVDSRPDGWIESSKRQRMPGLYVGGGLAVSMDHSANREFRESAHPPVGQRSQGVIIAGESPPLSPWPQGVLPQRVVAQIRVGPFDSYQKVIIETDHPMVVEWFHDIDPTFTAEAHEPFTDELVPRGRAGRAQRVRVTRLPEGGFGSVVAGENCGWVGWAADDELLGLLAETVVAEVGIAPDVDAVSIGPGWLLRDDDRAVVVVGEFDRRALMTLPESNISPTGNSSTIVPAFESAAAYADWEWCKERWLASSGDRILLADQTAIRESLESRLEIAAVSSSGASIWRSYELVAIGSDCLAADEFEAASGLANRLHRSQVRANGSDRRLDLLEAAWSVVATDRTRPRTGSTFGQPVFDELMDELTSTASTHPSGGNGNIAQHAQVPPSGDVSSITSRQSAQRSMRAQPVTAGGKRLAEWVREVGEIDIVSRSIKVQNGSMADDRELIWFRLPGACGSGAATDAGVLGPALDELGMPEEIRHWAVSGARESLHLVVGQDDGSTDRPGAMKFYLAEPSPEWWKLYVSSGLVNEHLLLSRGEVGVVGPSTPSAELSPDFVAWKWPIGTKGKLRTAVYWRAFGDLDELRVTLATHFGETNAQWSAALGSILSPRDVALPSAVPPDLLLIEDSGRESVYLQVGGPLSYGAHLEAQVRWLAALAGLDASDTDRLVVGVRFERIETVIGGLDGNAQPVATFYSAGAS